MNLHQKFAMSIVFASLLLCGNAFAVGPPTADAMATANLSVVITGSMNSHVNFPRTKATGFTCIDTYISGRLIDAPSE